MKKILILIIGVLISIATLGDDKVNKEDGSRGLSKIDREIRLKKKELKILENLKKKIREREKSGKNVKIGLALSGGGAKGFAHIGVLRVLEKMNIKIDYISGTSMGAIVAGLYAYGYSPDQIEVIVRTMDWSYRLSNVPQRSDISMKEKENQEKYIASISYDDKLNFNLPKGALSGEKSYMKLKELFFEKNYIKSFDELKPKLRIVATDFNTGKAKTFDHGNLAEIISASMAIPTIYDPVRIGDRVYIDGMVSRNLPVEDLYKAGADIVIASDVGAPQVEVENFNFLTVVNKISTYRGSESTLEQRKLASVVIDPDIKLENPANFENSTRFIQAGEKAAREKTMELKKYISKGEKRDERKLKRIDHKAVFIKKIEIGRGEQLTIKTIENLLPRTVPGRYTYKELEDLSMQLYAEPYIEKAYYTIKDDILIIRVDERNLNKVRVGGNYHSRLGGKVAIETELARINTLGRATSLDLELGSYNSIFFRNFLYYGEKNRIGLQLDLGLQEDPLLIYENRKVMARGNENLGIIDASLSTHLFRQFEFAVGVKSINSEGKFQEGEKKYKSRFLGHQNYNTIYLKLKLDRRNENIYPTSGIYIDLRHRTQIGNGTTKLALNSELGTIEKYYRVSPRVSINFGASGGVIYNEDGNTPRRTYFKLGGINNNLDRNYVSFYGYSIMRKWTSKFIIAQIGANYEMYKNLYLIGKINSITYESENKISNTGGEKHEFMKEPIIGYGVTLGYKSPIGPIGLTLMNDAEYAKNYIISLNIGYMF